MLGGAASAKTASYTLVAADAGSAITMSNASATTITVNTALFAAGDTVQITNLGAGVCTITAGTATVNTSASLALAQYESGTLDFTSTSAAIFIKGAGAAATSGGMTLISTTTLTGAQVDLTSIPQTYNSLTLVIRNYLPATDADRFCYRFNADSNTRYRNAEYQADFEVSSAFSQTKLNTAPQDNAVGTGLIVIDIPDYTNATTWKMTNMVAMTVSDTNTAEFRIFKAIGVYNQTAAISQINLFNNVGNFTSGTALLYGVK